MEHPLRKMLICFFPNIESFNNEWIKDKRSVIWPILAPPDALDDQALILHKITYEMINSNSSFYLFHKFYTYEPFIAYWKMLWNKKYETANSD